MEVRHAVRKISELRVNPSNPRVIRDKRFKELKKSIEQDPKMLEAERITVSMHTDRMNVIVMGNQRYEAVKSLGWKEIPVTELYDGTEEEEKRWGMKSNLHFGEHDWDRLANEYDMDFLKAAGFDEKELDKLLGKQDHSKDDEFDADAVAEAIKEPITKRGDIWQLGRHRLMCGDSTVKADVEKLMDEKKADMVFTSFPYGVGVDYGTYDDSFENCRDLIRKSASILFDFLREGGFCITNFGDIISAQKINKTKHPSEYPMAIEYWPAFTTAGFILNSRRIWAKPHAKVAAPWCASSNRAASDWEHLWTWLKPGKFLNERRDPSYLGIWDTSKMENVEIGKDVHPAAFPVCIAAMGLKVYTNSNDVVFEPFGGTGTTLIACEKLGRVCNIMEIDEKFSTIIINRWEKYTNKTAVKICTKYQLNKQRD